MHMLNCLVKSDAHLVQCNHMHTLITSIYVGGKRGMQVGDGKQRINKCWPYNGQVC